MALQDQAFKNFKKNEEIQINAYSLFKYNQPK